MRIQTSIVLFMIISLSACHKDETASVFYWEGDNESRKIILLDNGDFIYTIDEGYYQRTDTGRFVIKGDTLVLNPQAADFNIDSIATTDTLFMGQRFLEVWEEEVVFDTLNTIVHARFNAMTFPSVWVNDTIALTVSEDDPAYKKLVLPDSIEIASIRVAKHEESTCKPTIYFTSHLPDTFNDNISYRVYIKSRKGRDRYLAGFKWLIKSDTIESVFRNDDCLSADIKMVRVQAEPLL